MIVEEWAEAGNLWRLMAAAAGGMLTEQQLVSMVLEPLVRYGSLRPIYFGGWPWLLPSKALMLSAPEPGVSVAKTSH